MTIDRIINIPELAEQISSYLLRNDFRSCVLVSRTWFEMFSPKLWESIQCTISQTLDQAQQSPTKEELQVFSRNSQFIRTLRSNSYPIVKACLTVCTRLRNIYLPRIQEFNNTTFFEDILSPAIQNNKDLERFVLKSHPGEKDFLLEPLSLQLISGSFESLRYLDICSHPYIVSIETYTSLVKFSKQLYSFRFSFSDINTNDLNENSESLELEQTQLRVLELNGSFYRLILQTDGIWVSKLFLPLIRASPHLEKLRFPLIMWEEDGSLIARTIRECSPNLRSMDIGSVLIDVCRATLIENCSRQGLVSIKQSSRSYLGIRSISALLQHCHTLDSVEISGCFLDVSVFITTDVIGPLLHRCPNLRVLIASLRNMYKNPIIAAGLLTKPWVCKKLEVLRFEITSVYNAGYYIDGQRSREYLEENKRVDNPDDLHRKVYLQLSELERLVELSVGYTKPIRKRQTTMLRFSLESGLNILKTLTRLEVLDVNFTSPMIYRDELEWMIQHWPRLEAINGVDMSTVMERWNNGPNESNGPPCEIVAKVLNITKASDKAYFKIYDFIA